MDSGTVNCIEYLERNDPVDRHWPTFAVEEGFAEIVFGSALGILRAEHAELNATTAIMYLTCNFSNNSGPLKWWEQFKTEIQCMVMGLLQR